VKVAEFDLPSGEVHVWWASLEVSDSQIDELRLILSADERRRAERFRVPVATRRFIAARAALRSVLGWATGVKPAEIQFTYGGNGKPRLADDGPYFNASDSGDFVAVAVTSTEVGIDIELARPLRRSEGIARRICTDGEIEALARLSEEYRDTELLRLWTCKEAALKAIGTGLPGGVKNVEISFSDGGPPKLSRLRGENNEWTLLQPELTPGLLCSVVVRGSGWRIIGTRFSVHPD
jgi:4'-phosphopantetheinyl transferase